MERTTELIFFVDFFFFIYIYFYFYSSLNETNEISSNRYIYCTRQRSIKKTATNRFCQEQKIK